MGMFDFLKGGKKTKATTVTTAPSQVLRDNGINTSDLKVGFEGAGNIRLTGTASSASEIEKIEKIISSLDGVDTVANDLTVKSETAAAAPVVDNTAAVGDVSAETPETTHSDSGDASGDDEQSYTVKAGDTLWKISAQHYGNGSDYMKIFEANRDVLSDPDKIQVGQVLKIPA